jgi:hypothetical protein
MEMIINIWDSNVSHCSNIKEAGLRCGVRNNVKKIEFEQNVKWVHKEKNFTNTTKNGITVFTDNFLTNNLINSIYSDFKIGLIFEPIDYSPQPYNDVLSVEDSLDLIFTFNENLLKKNPKKYKYFPADWVCIEKESHGLNEKNKLVSMVYSSKGGLDRNLRKEVANRLNNKIDLFGSGTIKGQLDAKSDSLVPYMYSISIENSISENYYTEKILDCFITGNIPIYRGCPNISDFFDSRGIIEFNDITNVDNIINNISIELYMEMLPYIKINHEISKKYINPDDTLLTLINMCFENPNYNTKEYFKYVK